MIPRDGLMLVRQAGPLQLSVPGACPAQIRIISFGPPVGAACAGMDKPVAATTAIQTDRMI